MINLQIFAPLPLILGFSSSSNSLKLEIPFSVEISVEYIFTSLAVDYPKFSEILHDEKNMLLNGLVILVNNSILKKMEERKNPLADGSKIVLLTPYSGG